MVHEQIKLHIVVSMLCIFNFAYYEETCLNEVVIWTILDIDHWMEMSNCSYAERPS